jgi:Ala-tRNA(Pro) deacylase
MPVQKLKDLLDREGIKYITISHSPAYTAMEVAATAHIPGKEMAKTVIVKLDGKMAMLVLPASRMVDLDLIEKLTGSNSVALATESEFKDAFPGCEIGAMPPFGNLYGMNVFVAESLTKDEEIAFNAGSHTELIRLAYADFERLVQPRVARFAVAD